MSLPSFSLHTSNSEIHLRYKIYRNIAKIFVSKENNGSTGFYNLLLAFYNITKSLMAVERTRSMDKNFSVSAKMFNPIHTIALSVHGMCGLATNR